MCRPGSEECVELAVEFPEGPRMLRDDLLEYRTDGTRAWTGRVGQSKESRIPESLAHALGWRGCH